ncbi:hypothetical protein BD289DRAFT_484772 [Coniella lustricola]|uniref:Uncharacterized protein n=1 Tax=Coniella lustricola TaxID=2025994 RepID=A0A2T3A0Y2_9PEZI|nr:hypothetical protein BD289DRAFT_484772 [Coniella lustricola]
MRSSIQNPLFVALSALVVVLVLHAQLTVALTVPTHGRYTTKASYRSIPQASPHSHAKRLDISVSSNVAGKVAGGAAGLVILSLVLGLGSASIAVLGSVEWAELRGKNKPEQQQAGDEKAALEKATAAAAAAAATRPASTAETQSDADSILEAKLQAARQQAGTQASRTTGGAGAGAGSGENGVARFYPGNWLPTIDVKRLTRMTVLYPRDGHNAAATA